MKKLVKVLLVLIAMVSVYGALKAKDSIACTPELDMLKTCIINEHGKSDGLNKDNTEVKIQGIKDGYVDYKVYKNGEWIYVGSISEKYLRNSYQLITNYNYN